MKLNEIEVKYDGRIYCLNPRTAIEAGVMRLSIDWETLRPVDVFCGISINNLLLVRCIYGDAMNSNGDDKHWQLLGIGCSPNSNLFYRELRSLKEVAEYLESKNATWVKNIGAEVTALVG